MSLLDNTHALFDLMRLRKRLGMPARRRFTELTMHAIPRQPAPTLTATDIYARAAELRAMRSNDG